MTTTLSTETLEFIERHRNGDVRSLALQSAGHKNVDMTAALEQIEGWQTACRKLPLWSRTAGMIYPPRLSMEQCSSEETARYKAETIGGGDSFADLTGGFGVDCSWMARGFKQAWYVERNEKLCALSNHNFKALGLTHIHVCHEEAAQFLSRMQPKDVVFLDPARRDAHGGKTVAITDCTPDVKALFPLLKAKARRILIKLSPMLDITQALSDLPGITEVHVISVNNECKELLLLYDKRKGDTDDPTFHTVNMSAGTQRFAFTRQAEATAECQFVTAPETYLYEPNASLLKAGAFHILSPAFHVKKLQENSHLYTSTAFQDNFPGRIFKIDAVSGFGKRELKTFLSDIPYANLTVRNFPGTVAGLRKRLKLKDGGDVYIFATTLQNKEKVLIKCRKASF